MYSFGDMDYGSRAQHSTGALAGLPIEGASESATTGDFSLCLVERVVTVTEQHFTLDEYPVFDIIS